MYSIKKGMYWSLVLFAISFMFSSCGKEDTPVNTVFNLSNTSFLFNDDATASFTISHASGDAINWQISSIPAWLDVSINSGTISSGQSASVVLTPATVGFPAGKLSGVIEVKGNNNQTSVINVTVCVAARPIIQVSPAEKVVLNEANGFYSQITVRNTGSGILTFEVSKNEAWLELIYPVGIPLEEGQEVYIDLFINDLNHPIGTLTDRIRITSNTQQEPIEIEVDFEIPPRVEMLFIPRYLEYGFDTEQITTRLVNQGNAPANWRLEGNPAFATITPSEGTIGAGEEIEVVVEIDRSEFGNGEYSEFFQFVAGDLNNFYFDLTVSFKVYTEEKVLLTGGVVDCEYDPEANSMFMITEFPNQLLIYDSADGSVLDMALSYTPIELQKSNNGLYVAVASLSKIFVYDANTSTERYQVDKIQSDDKFALNPSGDLFLFSEGTMKAYSNGVELASSSHQIGLLNDVKPAGEDIYYGVSNATKQLFRFRVLDGNEGIDIEKSQNIQGNEVIGKLWFSESSKLVILQDGNVYRSNLEDVNSDLSFIRDMLPDQRNIFELDYSSDLNMISTVIGDIDMYFPENMYIHGSQNFRASDYSYFSDNPPPYYLLNNGSQDFVGQGQIRFVGINPDKQTLVVVSFAEFIEENWAISEIQL